MGLHIYTPLGQAESNKYWQQETTISEHNDGLVGDKPLLRWNATPDAVMYELSF
jgi:hypothetical protein